jgi:carbonic anhydrase
MTRMTALLERNEKFAARYTAIPIAPPRAGMIIVTCMEHRVDPAITLGLELGDAAVIRNTGGRITGPVVEEVAYIAQIGEQLFGSDGTDDQLFEVALIHHTQCGSGFLAEPGFRQQFAARTGRHETELEALAVTDPHATVQADVERLLASPMLSPRVSVSGHVYDIATGRLTIAVEARYP